MLQSAAAPHGTVILPTKPRTPRHKGKTERGVGYAQDNALKGRQFENLEQQNRHLFAWEANVADQRIHGTTRQQVGKVFAEIERPALLPLPRERFAARDRITADRVTCSILLNVGPRLTYALQSRVVETSTDKRHYRGASAMSTIARARPLKAGAMLP